MADLTGAQLASHMRAWRRDATESDACPVRDVLSQLADKWSVLIVTTLGEKPYRFGELKREIGDISQRMLTQTLRDLQSDGLIERQVFPTTPPSVEYRLSPLGKSFLEPLATLVEWAFANRPAIRDARQDFAGKAAA
jgi:DNA-binding HxlR family transcriptional regulator